MGHSGDPKTADSQFYILLGPQPSLDAKYTVFGRVIKGMDVVDTIQRADVLKRATVRVGPGGS
jgi:cyclophilin family peptidyl-prolyl cis-trans isomerase